MSNDKKREINKLAKEYNVKFFNADNFIDKKYGAGCECCGTEKLRNYKLLSCDKRSREYGNEKGSKEFENCKANFVRDRTKTLRNKTIREVCDEELEKK